MWKQVGVAGLLVVLALTIACEGDDEVDEPGRQADEGGVAPSAATGPGLTIAEAKASELDGPLLVNGFIVAVGDDVKLCSALLESLPPQCGGESLAVEGVDLSSIEGTQSAGNTTWTSDLAQLLGEVDGEVITVAGTSMG